MYHARPPELGSLLLLTRPRTAPMDWCPTPAMLIHCSGAANPQAGAAAGDQRAAGRAAGQVREGQGQPEPQQGRRSVLRGLCAQGVQPSGQGGQVWGPSAVLLLKQHGLPALSPTGCGRESQKNKPPPDPLL